jgi:type III secretion protein V
VDGERLISHLRGQAAHLLNPTAVDCLLDMLRDTDAALVDAATGRFDVVVLTWILRDLIADGVSVQDLRSVLEGLLSNEGSRASARDVASVSLEDVTRWSDWIREELKRQIAYRLAGNNVLEVCLLRPELETRLAAAAERPLSAAEHDALVASIDRIRNRLSTTRLVILTTRAVRRVLQHAIAIEVPWAAVLAYQELSPEMNIRPVAHIGADPLVV